MPTGSQMRYLHIIYQLSEGKDMVRSVDIASRLSISRTSVHNMLKALAGMHLIIKCHYGCIHLTEEGLTHGKAIHEQYEALYDFFFRYLELPPITAADSAYLFLGNLPALCVSRLMEKSAVLESFLHTEAMASRKLIST